jgi:hypothetical protein
MENVWDFAAATLGLPPNLCKTRCVEGRNAPKEYGPPPGRVRCACAAIDRRRRSRAIADKSAS